MLGAKASGGYQAAGYVVTASDEGVGAQSDLIARLTKHVGTLVKDLHVSFSPGKRNTEKMEVGVF